MAQLIKYLLPKQEDLNWMLGTHIKGRRWEAATRAGELQVQ